MCLAIPGQILSISGEDPMQRMGQVSFGGVMKQISLALVPEAKEGDYVIVHVGVALNTLDAEEAERSLEYFRAMGELKDLEATVGPAQPGSSLDASRERG